MGLGMRPCFQKFRPKNFILVQFKKKKKGNFACCLTVSEVYPKKVVRAESTGVNKFT